MWRNKRKELDKKYDISGEINAIKEDIPKVIPMYVRLDKIACRQNTLDLRPMHERLAYPKITAPEIFDTCYGKRQIKTFAPISFISDEPCVSLWYSDADTGKLIFELSVTRQSIEVRNNDGNLTAEEIDLAILEYEEKVLKPFIDKKNRLTKLSKELEEITNG